MSFSSLPTELVRQIIESTVPSTFHSTTYRERQYTLRSLCLVCKRFRHIVQPILRQIVVSSSQMQRKVGSASALIEQWTTLVRQIVLTLQKPDDLRDFAASRGSKVKDLILPDYDFLRTDLSPLSRFTELQSLRIYCSCLQPSFLPFPSLRTLTIGGPSGGVDLELEGVLNRTNFPSLQALALTHFSQLSLLRLLRESSSLHLIEMLDAFFISNFDHLEASLDALKTVLPSTLITCRTHGAVDFASTLRQSLHIRLDGPPAELAYLGIANLLENSAKSPLRSLYLDVSLSPRLTNPTKRFQDGLDKLVKACTERKVEIIYEEVPLNWTVDPVISPEFWRRQRERKRLGGNQAKQKSTGIEW